MLPVTHKGTSRGRVDAGLRGVRPGADLFVGLRDKYLWRAVLRAGRETNMRLNFSSIFSGFLPLTSFAEGAHAHIETLRDRVVHHVPNRYVVHYFRLLISAHLPYSTRRVLLDRCSIM